MLSQLMTLLLDKMARSWKRASVLVFVLAFVGCANAESDSTPSTSGAGSSSVSGAGGAAAPGGAGASAISGAAGAGVSPGAGGAGSGAGGGPAAGGTGTGTAGAGTGLAGAGVAGSPSAGAGGAAAACPGVPIVTDSSGNVAKGSNTLAITGNWFVYSDCVDLKNVNCAQVQTPMKGAFTNVGGKMCTKGTTSMAAGAWGAGIGFELNDGPPQMPYDTTAHSVKGFCFVLSGPTIPPGLRAAFPTKNNPDDAYFKATPTVGQQTVLFADTAQGSWVTAKKPFEPTMVMLLQFQIPSSTTAAIPWDFCVEGLTAITLAAVDRPGGSAEQ
jgi:hypothetical protein